MIEAVQARGAATQVPAATAEEYHRPIAVPADALVDVHRSEAAREQHLWEDYKPNDQSVVPEPVQLSPAAAQPQQDGDGAPVKAQPSAEPTTEQQLDPEAPALPPIEPPRSWTKEAKQRFRSLPRETQEYLSVREQERDREVRRSQNEAAEARKAVEAERQAAARAKQQYEQTLPRWLEAMEAATHEDVQNLAKQDPLRHARYAARQQKLAFIAQEAKAAEARQRAEEAQRWNKYAAEQDQLLIERVHEFADADSRVTLQQAATDYLSEIGFSREEMTALYHGSVLRDARIQMIVLDGARYRQACNAAKAALQVPVPSVQSLGVNQPRVDPRWVRSDSPNQRLEQTED